MLALSLWERERVRANLTLSPNPSPKGEGKNGAAQRHVARSSFLSGNIRLTHYPAEGPVRSFSPSPPAGHGLCSSRLNPLFRINLTCGVLP
jgi:hypothetical protein